MGGSNGTLDTSIETGDGASESGRRPSVSPLRGCGIDAGEPHARCALLSRLLSGLDQFTVAIGQRRP